MRFTCSSIWEKVSTRDFNEARTLLNSLRWGTVSAGCSKTRKTSSGCLCKNHPASFRRASGRNPGFGIPMDPGQMHAGVTKCVIMPRRRNLRVLQEAITYWFMSYYHGPRPITKLWTILNRSLGLNGFFKKASDPNSFADFS